MRSSQARWRERRRSDQEAIIELVCNLGNSRGEERVAADQLANGGDASGIRDRSRGEARAGDRGDFRNKSVLQPCSKEIYQNSHWTSCLDSSLMLGARAVVVQSALTHTHNELKIPETPAQLLPLSLLAIAHCTTYSLQRCYALISPIQTLNLPSKNQSLVCADATALCVSSWSAVHGTVPAPCPQSGDG